MKTAFYALILSSLLTASIAFSADTISPEDAINHTSCYMQIVHLHKNARLQTIIIENFSY